jgi:lysophospholipase L1-like esterase
MVRQAMTTPNPRLRLSVQILLGLLALNTPFVRAQAPAPVPDAVAIARPSPGEISQVDASLRQFIAQADPATKAIVARYPDLLAVRPPRVNPATVPFLNPGFRRKHDAYVELAKKGGIDLLFMGDSITDFWRNAPPAGEANPARAGKAVWDKYYGSMNAANFGISGDHTAGVLWRLQNGEGQGFQPKAIVLMIGTNDSEICSSAEIAEGVGADVLELRKDFPDAKILLLGIFPRGNPDAPVRKLVLDVNPIIARLNDGQHVFYLDIGSKFLDPNGVIQPDIMADKLHPNQKGYEIWAQAIQGQLAEMMK